MSKRSIMVSPSSTKEMESLAKEFMKKVKNAYPQDIITPDFIFEYVLTTLGRLFPHIGNIKTGYRNLDSTGVLGYSNPKTRECFIDASLIDKDDDSTRRRRNATILHECGHIIKHFPLTNRMFVQNLSMVYCRSDIKLKPYQDPEWQAWAFALEALMPREGILFIMQTYPEELWIDIICSKYDVNPSFAQVRINKIKKSN